MLNTLARRLGLDTNPTIFFWSAGLMVLFFMMLVANPEGTATAFESGRQWIAVNLGWFFIPFAILVMVGASNAVNLTDGLDGLAIVPIMMAATGLILIGFVVFLVGEERKLFESKLLYNTHFEDVAGLWRGAPGGMGGGDVELSGEAGLGGRCAGRFGRAARPAQVHRLSPRCTMCWATPARSGGGRRAMTQGCRGRATP